MLAIFDRKTIAATLVVSFVLMALSPIVAANANDVQYDINIGPYVDKVVFKPIENRDKQILSLQTGEIEFAIEYIDPEYLPELIVDPDISIFSALRNGYGHFTINCGKYPLNISGFRRAFAYAFDKTRVRIELMDGFSQEHDSLIPRVNDWCIEEQMPYHYYIAQPEKGNQILDSLRFDIDPVSGFRKAPDGSSFNVIIEYGAYSEEFAGNTARIGVDALHSLHINAQSRSSPFNEILSRLDFHRDYDIVFYALDFFKKDVDWLAYEYWSEYVNVNYFNPCNFANKTYDLWRDRLLHSMTYSDVFEAASEMQMILQENVPRLVAYENVILQGYRNDVYTGHVEDLGSYISGPWTLRKIHKIDGTTGGTVNVAIQRNINSFNIFLGGGIIDTILWPSLYSLKPNLNPWPYLAEHLVTETHTENPSVPEGHTRFTVDLVQNATWSDGTPLTANDVAFTFTYLFESSVYGNPAAAEFRDLFGAYASTTYRAIIEFSSESYWHFSNFANTIIIPKHIFNNIDGIGYDGWNTWNPVFNPMEPYITSGPFTLTDLEIGEFYEFSANPDFCYFPNRDAISSTTPNSGTNNEEPFNMSLAFAAGAVGAVVVILPGGSFLLRKKRP